MGSHEARRCNPLFFDPVSDSAPARRRPAAEMAAAEKPARSEAFRALSACRCSFAMTGVFSLFINILMLTSPIYMLQIYDRELATRSYPTQRVLTVVAGGLLIVMGSLEFIRSRVLVRTGARLDGLRGGRVFAAVFARRLRSAGGQSSRPLMDLDTLRQFLTSPCPFVLQAPVAGDISEQEQTHGPDTKARLGNGLGRSASHCCPW